MQSSPPSSKGGAPALRFRRAPVPLISFPPDTPILSSQTSRLVYKTKMPLFFTADSSCDICFETFADPNESPTPNFDLLPSVVNCGHVFCRSCLYSVRTPHSNTIEANCPQCRVKFKFSDVRRIHIDRAPLNSTAQPASIIETTASAGRARQSAEGNAPKVLDKTLWSTLVRHEKRRKQDEHEARGTAESEALFEARCLLQASQDRAIYDDRASQALKHMLWRTRDHLAEIDKHSISPQRERGYVRLVHALAALTDYCMNKEAEAQHYAIKLLLTERESKRSMWLLDMFAEKLGTLQVQTGHRKEWTDEIRKNYMLIWRNECRKRMTPSDESNLAEGAAIDTNGLHMRRGVQPNYRVSATEGLLLFPQQPEYGLEPTRAQRPPGRQEAVDRQEAERQRAAERAARQPQRRLDDTHASYPWYICDEGETVRQRAEAREAAQPSRPAAPTARPAPAHPEASTSRAPPHQPQPVPDMPHADATVRGRDGRRNSMPRPVARGPSIHEQLAARSRRISDSRPMARRTRIDNVAPIVEVHAAPRRAPHPYPRPSRTTNMGA
ncbi:hypothetical protein PENSPDRAFT_417606 [Peniophora sp. CONT]|nr:hypothetical protein PENSPDRAFT_417606 [Peniophora sp. CONT]